MKSLYCKHVYCILGGILPYVATYLILGASQIKIKVTKQAYLKMNVFI